MTLFTQRNIVEGERVGGKDLLYLVVSLKLLLLFALSTGEPSVSGNALFWV